VLNLLRRRVSLGFLTLYDWFLRRIGRAGPYGVLSLELSGEIAEEGGDGRWQSLLRRPGTDYLSLLSMLRWARDDDRLQAVFLRCDGVDLGWARLQGLRRSIGALRRAGKRVWVHLNVAGLPEYYLASAADRVSVTPAATLDIVGLSSEAVFFFDALEKLGVEADVVQMGRYKSAGESFTRRDMSPAHREMMESLVDDLYGQLVDDIAADRGLEVAEVRGALDRGPLLITEAVEAKLVDQIGYADEVLTQLRNECGEAEVVERGDYAARRGREMQRLVLRGRPRRVAVVHLSGTIRMGSGPGGLDDGGGTGARSFAKSFDEIRERDDLEAVVLRVSSPGGSGLASDLMWRDVVRTREKKPVVVSFGDVAASGGYFVALAGGPVFAESGTVTGSIGVVAGKATLRQLYDKVGVRKEIVSRGRHAAMHSDYVRLGAEERQRLEAEATVFYDDFVDKVAAARKLGREEAAAVAEGRVWTGRQALSHGLIDELGGFEEALRAAKAEIGLADDRPVMIERYPKRRPFWRTALARNRGAQSSLPSLPNLIPDLGFLLQDRLWAILPFHLRIR
jgi:protease-4